MNYPTELLEKAKFEMTVFERCSSTTCEELIAEVEQLRAWRANTENARRGEDDTTHHCVNCDLWYTPVDCTVNEDCPNCGYTGS